MEAVLSEIRQLRHDLQAAAFATRKAQIVIYRLHVQAEVLERATSRLEGVRNELEQAETQRRFQTEQIKRFEEMREHATNEQQRKQFEDYIAQFRANLEAPETAEQELLLKQVELEAALRAEEAKYERFEQELDELENSLSSEQLASNRK